MLEKIRNNPAVQKFKKGTFNVFEVIEEGIEGASVAYSTTFVVSYYPKLRTIYGFAFLGAGGAAGVTAEILHLTSALSNKGHHNYRLIKEALEGAAVAAIYVEGSFPKTLHTMIGGVAVTLVLATSKSLIEIFKNKPYFKTPRGKVVEYLTGSIYDGLSGAGFIDYLLQICEGFDVEIHPYIRWPLTALVALMNIAANLPFIKDNKDHALYTPARISRSALYAAINSLFLMIFMFDLIVASEKSHRITTGAFAGVIIGALMEGTIMMINKLMNDKKEENELAHSHSEYEGERQHLIVNIQDEEPRTLSLLFREEEKLEEQFEQMNLGKRCLSTMLTKFSGVLCHKKDQELVEPFQSDYDSDSDEEKYCGCKN